jgi:hypothetical protein
MWEKIKARFRHSATILWARLVGFGGLVIAILGSIADLFELPGIKESIQALLDPRHVPYYIIAFALITELARRRTLNRDAE